jgi:hypothetical protein
MSKQPVRGVDVDRIEEEALAEYLQMNPEFFERHAGLLTKLKLTHNRGAATVSLIERQVAALRDKNQSLEARLRELIEVARSNATLRRSSTHWKRRYARTSAPPNGSSCSEPITNPRSAPFRAATCESSTAKRAS